MKFPQLEELDIAFTNISKESLEVIAKSCPLLKTLKYRSLVGEDIEENDEALIITHNMHELRHLETYGTMITNNGIIAILNGCPLLQYLDLRSGFHLDMSRGTLTICHKNNTFTSSKCSHSSFIHHMLLIFIRTIFMIYQYDLH